MTQTEVEEMKERRKKAQKNTLNKFYKILDLLRCYGYPSIPSTYCPSGLSSQVSLSTFISK